MCDRNYWDIKLISPLIRRIKRRGWDASQCSKTHECRHTSLLIRYPLRPFRFYTRHSNKTFNAVHVSRDSEKLTFFRGKLHIVTREGLPCSLHVQRIVYLLVFLLSSDDIQSASIAGVYVWILMRWPIHLGCRLCMMVLRCSVSVFTVLCCTCDIIIYGLIITVLLIFSIKSCHQWLKASVARIVLRSMSSGPSRLTRSTFLQFSITSRNISHSFVLGSFIKSLVYIHAHLELRRSGFYIVVCLAHYFDLGTWVSLKSYPLHTESIGATQINRHHHIQQTAI